VEGDEDIGSPKVSYALSFTSNYDFYPGQEFIIGAGFYRNFSTAEAEQAAEDWLHRFSRSVASQAMEMIGNRVSHPYRPGDHVEVSGQSLDFGGYALAALLTVVYLAVGFFVHPVPETSNLGWGDGMFDNPFRFS